MGCKTMREYYERKNKGKCVSCNSYVPEGITYCKKCSNRISESSKIRRDYYKENGMCYICGKLLTDTDTLKNGDKAKSCNKCREYKRFYRKMKKQMEEENE